MVRAGLEPGITGFQGKRPNHWATLPLNAGAWPGGSLGARDPPFVTVNNIIETMSVRLDRVIYVTCNLGGIYMRPGRTQTDMNSYWHEIFAAVYMKPGRDAWCLVSG